MPFLKNASPRALPADDILLWVRSREIVLIISFSRASIWWAVPAARVQLRPKN